VALREAASRRRRRSSLRAEAQMAATDPDDAAGVGRSYVALGTCALFSPRD
jgi:hypothetical protein